MATLTREYSSRRQVPGSDERLPIGWVVQFDEKATGRRPKVRLGPVSKKVAENARRHIEHLIAARTMAASIDVKTAQWVAGLSDEIHERLERVGLVPARASRQRVRARQTLDGLIKQYVAARRPNLKPNTVRNLEQAGNKLVEGRETVTTVAEGAVL